MKRLTVLLVSVVLAGCDHGSNPASSASTVPGSPPVLGAQPFPAPPFLGAFSYLGTVMGGPSLAWAGSLAFMSVCDGRSAPGTLCARFDDRDQPFKDWVEDVGPGVILEMSGNVEPSGSTYQGTARAAHQYAVVGTVESLDLEHARLRVFGQTVHLTASTVLLADPLHADALVRVSGYVAPGGQVVATRVASGAPESPLELGDRLVRGVLEQREDGQLVIGGTVLEIETSPLGFPAGSPLPGDMVTAVGYAYGNVLRVTRLDYSGGRWGAGHLDMTGFVTGFRSATDFDVDGKTVDVGNCDCAHFASAIDGELVRLRKNEQGDATVAGFPDFFREIVVGPIDEIDAVAGTLRILGFTIQTNPGTLLRAEPDAAVAAPRISLADFAVGDVVTVHAEHFGEILVAHRIGRGGEGQVIEAYGVTFEAPYVRVAGRPILVDGATAVRRCEGCSNVGAGALFASANPYQMLKLVVATEHGALRATEVIMSDE